MKFSSVLPPAHRPPAVLRARSGLLCLAFGVLTTVVAHADIAPLPSFGDNPGALLAYDYVPAALPAKAPLVVVLHGCTQTASAMQTAGWNTLADEHGFAVLYPEQSTANNAARCFNWAGEFGNPANLTRGQGENQSIISMIDAEIAAHDLDPERVYVVGLSAGAAMTAVMLATWPERFAAGSIMAGIPYRCATSVNGAFSCQSPGVTRTPAQWGDLVRSASTHAGPFPRVQIWHGTSDTTVAPLNASQLVAQWTDVHGVPTTADGTTTEGPATITTYGGAVELWTIQGMGHGISVGGTDCPASTGAYFLSTGVCSTLHAAAFFGLLEDGTPPPPPDDGDDDDDDDDDGTTPPPGDDPITPPGSDDGGCTTGTPPGGLLGLALGALALRCRRRRPSPR